MIPTIDYVKYLRDYRLWIHFTDDTEGEIDLKSELWGEMFEPLLDTKEFAKVRINKELGTIVWPNGADLAPEFLYNDSRPEKSPELGACRTQGIVARRVGIEDRFLIV